MVEDVSRIEPCRLETIPEAISDAAAQLLAEATTLGNRLHPATAAALANVVRAMNTYYSNKIEGHNTTLREIESAMADDLSADEGRRNLQLEARAHMRVQAEIDAMYAENRLLSPTSGEFIRWLHYEFYRDMPEDLLRIKAGEHSFLMTSGRFRHPDTDQQNYEISVGRHLPPSSGRVEAFIAHFQQRFDLNTMGPTQKIIAMASAHHRLNFIHPFYDGNGRVSRLMSHAIALVAGIGAHGLWSISRGLARGLGGSREYMAMMEQADLPRRNSLDGRGNLSQETLQELILWFLNVSLDQVRFMSNLFDLDHLRDGLLKYAFQRKFRQEAVGILDEVAIRGEMPRGDAARATGLPERSARLVLSALIEDGVLASTTPKAPVSLRFPVSVAEVVFPRLFAEPS